ncbi:RNA-binding family protein [Perilla frutescens var. frutescens]|nr:RNA-binding family protein [Perilla frutescens var. frutescens]
MDTNMEDFSSTESEMKSSDEVLLWSLPLSHMPMLLVLEVKREVRPKQKRAKRQASVGPVVDKDVAHEAVGLKQIRISQKQNYPELQDNDSANELKEVKEPIPETSPPEPFATLEKLNSGKLPPEEILSLPKFKNYSAGDPTPVLYNKNLAKDVVIDDLYFIFGSFFESMDAAKSNLTVKLMQEGRMRGQAFVTFPTIELARNALSAVNGFVFKGKPIVIQFGRSPKLN